MSEQGFKPKHILVTGGCGFIGANFVRYVARNHPDVHITVLDKLTYAGNPANIDGLPQSQVELVIGDICDALLLERIVPGCDAIVHFAAESHNDNSIFDPEPFIRTNVEGTMRLLEAACKYGVRFHHISTDEVYGDLALDDPCKFTESTPYKPSSPYSASKAASDQLVRAWVRTYGLRATISNCSNNYGPYQFPEKLIPVVILKALGGEPIPVYGKGENVRDWLYVGDHCEALLTVVSCGKPGETYNIGGNNEKTNLELVELLCSHLDELRPRPDGRSYREQISFVQDRPGHDLRYAIDASKIRRELGWTPRQDHSSGFRKTIQWYLDHEEWWRGILSGEYRLERLGTNG